MKKNKKGVIILIILIIVIAIIACICVKKSKKEVIQNDETVAEEETKKVEYVEEIDDGVKINKSNKLNEERTVEGLKITNIQLTTKDGMTTFLADITNESGAKTTLKTAQIVLLDEEGNELTTLTGVIDGLEVGATAQLNISNTSNYIEAYDFKITLK